ncbi:MAG: hypothetical protein GX454_10890 [Brooklawnia sp.]|nr:hypothetical protein [Brooklawnia sp.]
MATQIAVVGTGYVGLSNAVILAQHNDVTAIDINAERVDKINHGVPPILDPKLEDYLALVPLSLTATRMAAAKYSTGISRSCVFGATSFELIRQDHENPMRESAADLCLRTCLRSNMYELIPEEAVRRTTKKAHVVVHPQQCAVRTPGAGPEVAKGGASSGSRMGRMSVLGGSTQATVTFDPGGALLRCR